MNSNKQEKSVMSATPLQCLVSRGGYIEFQIRVTEKGDHFINADIFEVISWRMDNEPLETELYCKAYMKWDGCCHVWFGEEAETNKPNDCLHICGVRSWKGHVAMMEALYRFAEENIKLFDASEKWDKNGAA